MEQLNQSTTMSIIEEIKQARENLVSDILKEKILNHIKVQLLTEEKALIWGAPHFSDQTTWQIEAGRDLRVPYKYHVAISQWLQSLGFCTRRWFNRGGVEQGMEIWVQ